MTKGYESFHYPVSQASVQMMVFLFSACTHGGLLPSQVHSDHEPGWEGDPPDPDSRGRGPADHHLLPLGGRGHGRPDRRLLPTCPRHQHVAVDQER